MGIENKRIQSWGIAPSDADTFASVFGSIMIARSRYLGYSKELFSVKSNKLFSWT